MSESQQPMSIGDRVYDLVAEHFHMKVGEVKPDASLEGDLNADSLDKIELIMEFENEFGLTIGDAEAEGIKTVADMVKYAEAHGV